MLYKVKDEMLAVDKPKSRAAWKRETSASSHQVGGYEKLGGKKNQAN